MQDPAVLADSSQHKQQYNDVLLASQAANDSMVGQQIDSYSPEHFGQTHMNLQGSTHSFSEQASKLAAQMTSIDQSGVMPSVDGPQPIPMPNETMPGQSLTVQGFTDTQGQGDQLSPDSQVGMMYYNKAVPSFRVRHCVVLSPHSLYCTLV